MKPILIWLEQFQRKKTEGSLCSFVLLQLATAAAPCLPVMCVPPSYTKPPAQIFSSAKGKKKITTKKLTPPARESLTWRPGTRKNRRGVLERVRTKTKAPARDPHVGLFIVIYRTAPHRHATPCLERGCLAGATQSTRYPGACGERSERVRVPTRLTTAPSRPRTGRHIQASLPKPLKMLFQGGLHLSVVQGREMAAIRARASHAYSKAVEYK